MKNRRRLSSNPPSTPRSSLASSIIRSSNWPSNAANWTCWKKWKPSSGSVLVQMPTWRLSSKRWKLPIECRPRRRKSSTCEKNRKRRWICTAKALQRGVAFRRRAWRKKVFELCRCTTPAGIHGMPTTTSWLTRSTRRIRIRPMGHYSKTSSREVYGKTHSSFVGLSLAVHRYAKSAEQETESKAVEKSAHVYDIHATILYLMGIDHKKLTYRYSGCDFRFTDVAGNVLYELL